MRKCLDVASPASVTVGKMSQVRLTHWVMGAARCLANFPRVAASSHRDMAVIVDSRRVSGLSANFATVLTGIPCDHV